MPAFRAPAPARRSAPVLAALALLGGGQPLAALPQDGPGEFDVASQGAMRIESERKLTVPDAVVAPLWSWLDERFTDASWLDDAAHQYSTTRGTETFFDTYFDDPALTVLAAAGGVRHRRRVVHSGSALRKDGRELLQIKVGLGDAAGVARGEIKFAVAPPRRREMPGDHDPVLGLVAREEREAVAAELRTLGLDPWSLRPVLTVEQLRRRIYVSDREGAFATLTLDQCKCDDHGAGLGWTELELELNEMRYTAASPKVRHAYEAVVDRIERDILAAFPGVVRDQTPKYVKAFRGIEAATVLPLRRMHALALTKGDLAAGAALLAVAVGVLGGAVVQARRRAARGGPGDLTREASRDAACDVTRDVTRDVTQDRAHLGRA